MGRAVLAISLLCLQSCSLLVGDDSAEAVDAAPPVDALPPAAACTTETVGDDCDPTAICHCGLCAFDDATCAPSSRRYAVGTSPGGACVAAATDLDTYFQHTCMRRSDGTVWCWGLNCDGQLGDHSPDATGTFGDCQSNVPVQVLQSEGGPPLSGVEKIQTGIFSTCALLDDGTVWCWGDNESGQLGAGQDFSALAFSKSPVQVVTDAGAPLENVRFIGAGGSAVCATDANLDMWCWGSNRRGQLGVGDFDDRNAATKVSGDPPWRFVDGGGEHMCASRNGDIGADELWCSGRDVFGALGNGDLDNMMTPSNCQADPDHPCYATHRQVIDELGVPLVSPTAPGLGNKFSCTATADPDQVYCWGENAEHALGDETLTGNPAFGATQFSATGVKLTNILEPVSRVVAGEKFACALIGDQLHCWGSDAQGQQGNGPAPSEWQSPNETEPFTGVRDAAAGFNHVCAILADRTVQCWGANEAGQLGVGDDSARDQPTPILSEFVCP